MFSLSEFKNVSILIGAVTETESLRKTVDTVLGLCSHDDLAEIMICYPDRVTPECLAVINELTSRNGDVPVISFEQTFPFMSFIVEMIGKAKGSHCITIDSDLALDLTLIPQMIEGAKKEPDTIFSASRWLGGNKFEGYGKIKNTVNFLSQKFLSVLYSSNLTDFTIPMQIAPTELYRSIRFEETNFALLLEMVLKPLRLGTKFIELPTDCHSRTQGKSSNSTLQLLSYLKVAFRVRFMSKSKILK